MLRVAPRKGMPCSYCTIKFIDQIQELRSKIKRIEGDREKELADHGSILAAMQQQYAKERATNEQLEKQVSQQFSKGGLTNHR